MNDANKKNTYVCPTCHGPIGVQKKIHTEVREQLSRITCDECGKTYKTYYGCVDFVSGDNKDDAERTFYQEVYSKNGTDVKGADVDAMIYDFKKAWNSELFRERREVIDRMGDISNKTVLCIGNGTKEKELYFSSMGAKLIISDISIASVLAVKKKHGDIFDDVDFHAIDAYKIPLSSDSVDMIYGWQMTHHLCDLGLFLKEIRRVLKKGGKAVFVDNAYSPMWHWVKWKILRPFVCFVHKKKGVSPRDLYVSRKGDYKEEFLSDLSKKSGFKNFKAKRLNLFLYMFSKAVRDVAGITEIKQKNRICYPIAKALSWIDDVLCERFGSFKKNLRNMVWSFEK